MNAALPAAVRVVDLETTGSRPPEDGVVELGWQDVVEDGGAWRVGGAEQRGFQRGLVFPAPRTILSMALGRENVVHIALTDAAAARRVANAIARWQAFIDPDAGLDGASVKESGADGPGSTDELDEGHS